MIRFDRLALDPSMAKGVRHGFHKTPRALVLQEDDQRPAVRGVDQIRRSDGAILRLRPKLMTVAAVLASLIPVLWETGVGSDVTKPIAAPIVGGMVTSTINVLILIPVLFVIARERARRRGTLRRRDEPPTF